MNASVEQAAIDFNKQVLLTVEEFNLQERLVQGAAEADTVARYAYEISKRRFMMGNVDILKLNATQTSSIAAKRSYINALEQYWNYFYTIRQLTLYDFEKQESLLDRLDELVGK